MQAVGLVTLMFWRSGEMRLLTFASLEMCWRKTCMVQPRQCNVWLVYQWKLMALKGRREVQLMGDN